MHKYTSKNIITVTCIALLPILTTSNNIMFSTPFCWWWPFIRFGPEGGFPPPFPLLLFSAGPFLPFLQVWTKKKTKKKTSWLTYITLTILQNWKQKYQESCWLSFNLIYRRMSFKYKKVTWQLRPLCFPWSSHYFLIL